MNGGTKGDDETGNIGCTPFFLVCSNVTGIVAADDWVPNAVK